LGKTEAIEEAPTPGVKEKKSQGAKEGMERKASEQKMVKKKKGKNGRQ